MTIEQRVAKLEKQNRWMKRGCGLALAAVACVVLVGQGKAKELPDLVAKSLTIKDAGGNTRVEIGTGDRLAFVRLNGKSGKEQMGLNVFKDQPILELRDKRGKERLSLLVMEKHAELTLYTKDGKERMSLRVIKDSPHLVLSGVNGDRLNLSVYEDEPVLELRDKRGKERVSLSIFKGGPSLILSDLNEQPRAVLGVTNITNKRTGAKTETAENTLTMYDAKGTVIWQAPK